MGQFTKWLLEEDQKQLFEYLFANFVNIVFLVLTALLLWPLGKLGMSWRLTKGYWAFWVVMVVTSAIMSLLQRIFRMDLYSNFNAYLISALVVSGFLQIGWSAYAALLIRDSTVATPIWIAIILYLIGVISCYVATVIVGAFYMGGIYRLVNAFLAFASFILFSIWPGAAAAIFGWFFRLTWLGS